MARGLGFGGWIFSWFRTRGLGRGWYAARGIARVEILTRASYLTLFLVPILAALWPGVRAAIHGYNKNVTQVQRKSEELSAQLLRLSEELELTTFEMDEFKQVISAVKAIGVGPAHLNREAAEIEELIKSEKQGEAATMLRSLASAVSKLGESVNEVPPLPLPSAFVRAFLASLGVMAAHLVYQVCCPTLVQERDIEAYTRTVQNTYSQSNSATMVEHAKRELAGGWIHTVVVSPSAMIDVHHSDYDIDKPLDTFLFAHEGFNIVRWNEDEKRNHDIVGEGARVEYDLACQKGRPMALLTLVLYMFSIWQILNIIYNQTLAVMRAGDWPVPS